MGDGGTEEDRWGDRGGQVEGQGGQVEGQVGGSVGDMEEKVGGHKGDKGKDKNLYIVVTVQGCYHSKAARSGGPTGDWIRQLQSI